MLFAGQVESLSSKLGATDTRFTQIEKKVSDGKSGLKDAESRLCELEVLVNRVAAACTATATAVDKKHAKLKDSMGCIKQAADLSLAKCTALADVLQKRQVQGAAREQQRQGGPKNYFAHVTLEKCLPHGTECNAPVAPKLC